MFTWVGKKKILFCPTLVSITGRHSRHFQLKCIKSFSEKVNCPLPRIWPSSSKSAGLSDSIYLEWSLAAIRMLRRVDMKNTAATDVQPGNSDKFLLGHFYFSLLFGVGAGFSLYVVRAAIKIQGTREKKVGLFRSRVRTQNDFWLALGPTGCHRFAFDAHIPSDLWTNSVIPYINSVHAGSCI